MTETKWEIRIRCDGEVVLAGDINKVHGMESGRIRSYQFPCARLVQFDIVKYKVSEKKRSKRHYGGYVKEA